MDNPQFPHYEIRSTDGRWYVYGKLTRPGAYLAIPTRDGFATKKEAKEALMKHDPRVKFLTEEERLALLIREGDDE